LKGRLTVTLPDGDIRPGRIAPAKSFDSQTVRDIPAKEFRFRLQAKRFLFVKSWIRLHVLQGTARIGRRGLGPGQTMSLPSGRPHVLTAQLVAGEMTISITVSV